MAIRITDDTMSLETGKCAVAAARFSGHAAAYGNGAWIVSTCTAHLFDRGRAITALTVAELRDRGYAGDDPLARAEAAGR